MLAPVARSSLRRSLVRRRVLASLVKVYPNGLRISEVCRDTGLAPNEVVGALRGIPNQYLSANSLIALGMVEEMVLKGSHAIRLYRASKSTIDHSPDFIAELADCLPDSQTRQSAGW